MMYIDIVRHSSSSIYLSLNSKFVYFDHTQLTGGAIQWNLF